MNTVACPRSRGVERLAVGRGPRWLRAVRTNPSAFAGLALGLIMVAAAIGAPILSPFDPFQQSAAQRLTAPDAEHLLGRDTFGRDTFVRVLYAGRVSLTVGIGSVLIGGLLGSLLGLIAGYFRGRWSEQDFMRGIDVLMAFPSLLLGLAVVAVLGAGMEKLLLAIGVVLAPPFARLVYGATLSLNEREFVEAARALGARPAQVVVRHIVPNLLGETVVLASLLIASAIRIEASLSFIGVGVPHPRRPGAT